MDSVLQKGRVLGRLLLVYSLMKMTKTECFALYRELLRIRVTEQRIASRYSEQRMRCPTHLSIGQEAVAVGVSSALKKEDRVYSSHRAHAHYLAKGGSLKALIAELYGKSTGCTGGRGGSMHLSDLSVGFVASTAIVANSIPVAVGNALHQKLAGVKDISVAYFGEGATEEGAFYESLNFAAVKKLPILFVCENNRYSVYSDLSCRQPSSRQIVDVAKSLGVEAFAGNGNNLIEVALCTKEKVTAIREGNGPVLLELHTYRYLEHCGPNSDDHLNYRPAEELTFWQANDPLEQYENFLKGEYSDFVLFKDSITRSISEEIDKAFEFAEQSPFPDAMNNYEHLYG